MSGSIYLIIVNKHRTNYLFIYFAEGFNFRYKFTKLIFRAKVVRVFPTDIKNSTSITEGENIDHLEFKILLNMH